MGLLKTVKLLMQIHAFLFICPLQYSLSSKDFPCPDYKTPKDCIAEYTWDYTGAVLKCETLPYIDVNDESLSAAQTNCTQSLQITCAPSIPFYESTFSNSSFSHLLELKEIVFLGCKFLNLERNTFSPLEQQLQYLTIRSKHTEEHTLSIHKMAIGDLHNLEALDLANNNIKSLPENEFCPLQTLKELILQDNALTNITALGFSGTCMSDDLSKPCCINLAHLILARNHFAEIPSKSFCKTPHLNLLSIEDNNLTIVEAGTFLHLHSLTELSLSFNEISALVPDTWLDLNGLTVLNISHNQISGSLNESTFRHLKKLQSLDVSFNQIQSIHNMAFVHLTDLMVLSLSNNQIEHLDESTFSSLFKLEGLLLQENRISTISNNVFSGMPNLKFLWLHNNKITKVDDDAFEFGRSIINLRLDNCSLTTLPNISHLSNLTTLDLSTNHLKFLPENSFAGMTNLNEISLTQNSLENIPTNLFVNVTNLLWLNLANNQLTEIGEGTFKANMKLKNLLLEHNAIRSLVNFQLNTQLISLDISYNAITKLDYGILPVSLTKLKANNNRISSVIETLFIASKIPITHMDLSHNELTVIRKTTLPSTLKIVHLDNNKISRIEEGSFSNMSALELVSLESNYIETMSKRALLTSSSSSNRPNFLLSGNRLMCTCDMLWMKTINTGANVNYGFIRDLENMYCWVPVPRENQRKLRLIVESDDSSFLCEFKWYNFLGPFCYQPIPDMPKICNFTCPERCTCYHDQNWNAIITICSNLGNQTALPTGLAKSTVYYLDGTFISSLDENSFGYYPELDVLYLNNSGLQSIGDKTFSKMPKLRILHLENNNLNVLTSGVFDSLVNLEELYLSSNELRGMHEEVFAPLQNLKVLHLQNNRLEDFPVWTFVRMPMLNKIALSGNPWSCDCDYIEKYRQWLQEAVGKIVDVEHLMCYPQSDSSMRVSLIDFNSTFCVEHLRTSQIPVIAGTSAVFITITIISILIFIYRHEMQVLVYSRYGVRILRRNKEVDDAMKQYDAFISYSNDDEEFVVFQLLPKLENLEFPYKLCLHHRDFAVGAFITESILEAVEYSRRTLLVLTENFIRSEWCRFEFKTAHLQMMKDRCNRVIMIVVGQIPKDLDPEMKLYLKTNTYLQWDDKLFWQKLYFALPEKRPLK